MVLTWLEIGDKFLVDRILLEMLFVILDQLGYLLDKLILRQRLRLWGSRVLCLILINLLDLLLTRLVQAWRRGLIVRTHIGGGAECRSLRGLLGLSICGTIRVATHGPWEEVLLLNLMLHILLLLSGNRAFIRRCALDVIARVDTTYTWSVHGLGRDSAWLLSDLRGLCHCGGIELLLRDTSLRTTSVIALLRGWWDLEALDEFLIVLPSGTLSIPYTFNRVLQIKRWKEMNLLAS